MTFREIFGPMNYARPLWENEGGESGQGDGGEGGDGQTGEGTKMGEGNGEGEGGQSRSSILDFAPKGETNKQGQGEGTRGEGDAWKLPDGLELPDHLVGNDAEDTLRKLAPAYRGARQELSTRKRDDGVLEGDVPKDIDGYEITGENPDDPVFKDLTSEESKPIVDAWRKAALEIGIPNAAFSQFMQKGLANMQADGLSITGNPEEAARINGEAEMEGLVKAVGKDGADQMLRQIDTYAQKLANNGILQSQEDVTEFSQMVGTAKALQIMNRIIVGEYGEKPIPRSDGVDGAPTLDEAYQQHRDAMAMHPGADREDAINRAEAAIQKAMKESSTPGQIRSRVL